MLSIPQFIGLGLISGFIVLLWIHIAFLLWGDKEWGMLACFFPCVPLGAYLFFSN